MIKKRENCKNQDLWITSYADLMSAILAVLVLMVSFSKIDIEKYDMVQNLMIHSEKKVYSEFVLLKDIKKKIETIAKEHNLEDQVLVNLDNDGLTISFDSATQFDTAKYNLKKGAFKLLEPIFQEVIKQSSYRYIDISGYTDDVPGKTITNWELSALRALSIQRELEKYGLNNKNVRLLAYAENNPLVEYNGLADTKLNTARTKNRRVSIVIRNAKFDDLKK